MLPIPRKLKGEVLHSQSCELVSNVYKFMKREAGIGTPINLKAIQKSVAEATGVSERSVRRIINEVCSIESGTSASFRTPHKVRT
jgi:hypothetical protein